MNWENPYLWFCLTTGMILLVLLAMRHCRPLYRYVTSTFLLFSLYLFFTKSPEEGVNDFCTVDTIRILGINHHALADWHREGGGYPPPGPEGLEELKTYDSAVFFKDAWGRELRYEVVSGRPRLTSAGADGKFGTEDDIVR